MKLFISQRALQPGTVVKVDGWLGAAGVPALLETCSQAERPLVLDLRDLRDAEPEGVATLRRLVDAGAVVDALPPYIALLLSRRSA